MKGRNEMKTANWILASAMVALITQNSQALTSMEGTRGGGETVSENGAPVLRDVVDPATCQYFSGDDILSQNPMVAQILAKVSALDWYYAFDFQRQMRSLDYCLTSDLLRVNTADNPADQITDPNSVGPTEQAGIRSGNDVFLEKSIYTAMSPENRALLLIHETMHSYLPLDAVRRNFKLRSMVNSISDVYAGRIATRSALHVAMSQNSIEFPLSVDRLDPIKDFVLLVIADEPTERSILMSIANVDTLLSTKSPDPSTLTDQDAATFATLATDRNGEIMDPICEAKDKPLVAKLAGEAKSFDPAMVCLADTAVRSDAAFVKFLVDHANLNRSIQKAYQELASATISLQDYRIMISADVSGISATQKDSRTIRPMTELLPVSSSTENLLGSEFRGAIEGLALYAKVGNTAAAIAQTGKSPLFYQAFSVQPLLAQITALQGADPDEQALAKQVIPEVYSAFIQQLLNRVTAVAGADAAAQIQQSINFSQLGFTLNQ
jgi:hypothetical protein